MSGIDWSRVRWGRVIGLVWWLLVLLLVVLVPSLGEWPRSIVIWASIGPIVALLVGDEHA